MNHDLTSVAGGDHPREYGENNVLFDGEHRATGSSPRIRGECSAVARHGPATGIIPANTGRIGVRFDVVQESRDHPREYGENNAGAYLKGRRAGSSPRIRGE